MPYENKSDMLRYGLALYRVLVPGFYFPTFCDMKSERGIIPKEPIFAAVVEAFTGSYALCFSWFASVLDRKQ
jgi:hypothetical protein